MNRIGWLIVGVFLAVGVTIFADTQQTGPDESVRYTRACIFASGGWTEIDCSAAAAYSAALTAWTRYAVQANGGDAYFAQTTAGSGQDADSNDGYLPQGAWVELLTDDTSKYISCDASASGGTLRYIECK